MQEVHAKYPSHDVCYPSEERLDLKRSLSGYEPEKTIWRSFFNQGMNNCEALHKDWGPLSKAVLITGCRERPGTETK